MQRAADQFGVLHLHGSAPDADAALCRLFFQHGAGLVQQLRQVKGHLFQHDLAGFQLAHVQHFVHQLQQQGGRFPDLAAALGLPVGVLRVMVADLHHAADAVDGRADIVAHALQKFRLCNIGSFRLEGLGLELLLILLLPAQLLFAVALGRLPAQHLHQKEDDRIHEHRKQHVARGGIEHLGFRPERIHIEIAPALNDAVGAPRPGPAGVYMEHFSVGAIGLQTRQNGHIVHTGAQQGRIVAGHDLVAPGHHNGAVHLR